MHYEIIFRSNENRRSLERNCKLIFLTRKNQIVKSNLIIN